MPINNYKKEKRLLLFCPIIITTRTITMRAVKLLLGVLAFCTIVLTMGYNNIFIMRSNNSSIHFPKTSPDNVNKKYNISDNNNSYYLDDNGNILRVLVANDSSNSNHKAEHEMLPAAAAGGPPMTDVSKKLPSNVFIIFSFCC
jgi:hypothetical protein